MASGRRVFSYPEERPGFELPEKYRQQSNKEKPSRFQNEQNEQNSSNDIQMAQDIDRPRQPSRNSDETVVGRQSESDGQGKEKEKGKDGKKGDDTIVVDWYGDDDPENPQNWSASFTLINLSRLALMSSGQSTRSAGRHSVSCSLPSRSTWVPRSSHPPSCRSRRNSALVQLLPP